MDSVRSARRGDQSAADVDILPNELLGSIFLWGLASDPSVQQETLYLNAITSVCALWREVAVSNPLLWTEIRFHAPPVRLRGAVEFAELFRRAHTYLQRSKGALIRLQVSLDREDDVTINYLKATLEPHLSRCVFIQLAFQSFGVMRKFLPLCGPLRYLRSASVYCSGLASVVDPPVPLFDAANESPLQYLRLVDNCCGWLAGIPTAQLSNLEMEVNHGGWHRLCDFLDSCTATKSLQLDSFLQGYDATPIIILPALETLIIQDTLSMEFCNVISTPCLKHLEIYEPDSVDDFESHSPPTSPPFALHSLTITCFSRRSVSINTDSLHRALAPQTSLHTLTLDRSDHAIIPLLHLLASSSYDDTDGNGQILPALRLLKLHEMDGDHRKIWDRIGKVLDHRKILHIIWEAGGTPLDFIGSVLSEHAHRKYGNRLVVTLSDDE